MTSTLHIRPAAMDDLAILVAYNQALVMETENRRLDADTVSKGIQRLLEDPSKGLYWVAETEGRVVGHLMFSAEWSDWRCGEIWWLQSVYVSPDHRGQGVFKALYHHVLALARDIGVKVLRLLVAHENRGAQKVYAAVGMEKGRYDMFEVELKVEPIRKLSGQSPPSPSH
jgi:GNAT superfamily N-acetyltransferase